MSGPSGPSNNDYFQPGSIVKCVTCHNEEIQGEVLAFDHDTRFLVLKLNASSIKTELNDVTMINVDFLTSVDVVKESNTAMSSLTPLSVSKLMERFKEEMALRTTLAKAREAGVSNDGIQLFKFLRIAMPVNTLSWKNDSISVMDDVLVTPPYQSDNCVVVDPQQQHPNNPCLNHVKKIVERFHKEEKSKVQSQGST